MPTYEYQCQKCGHRFEKLQSINDKPLRSCPSCTGRVQRLLGTGAGLIFKGAGFYATDYRSQSYRQDAKADKQGAGAPSGEASADKKKSGQGDKK